MAEQHDRAQLSADPRSDQRTPYPWPADSRPTDEQVAEWLAACTPEERLERVRWWREQSEQGWRCFVENHGGQLDLINRPGTGRHRYVGF